MIHEILSVLLLLVRLDTTDLVFDLETRRYELTSFYGRPM